MIYSIFNTMFHCETTKTLRQIGLSGGTKEHCSLNKKNKQVMPLPKKHGIDFIFDIIFIEVYHNVQRKNNEK